ncbi:MAG: hypothetical protein KDA41_18070, partial [Planctomycetales bacterium]|nr:hypothetical protein [Planctomycetales bacterium]
QLYATNQSPGGQAFTVANQGAQQGTAAAAPPLLGPQNSVLQPNTSLQSQSGFSQYNSGQQAQQVGAGAQYTQPQQGYGSFTSAGQQTQTGVAANSGWTGYANDPARTGYQSQQPYSSQQQAYSTQQPGYSAQQATSGATGYGTQPNYQTQPQQSPLDLRGSTLTVANNTGGGQYAQPGAQSSFGVAGGSQTGVLQAPSQAGPSPYENVSAPRYDANNLAQSGSLAPTGQAGGASNWGQAPPASASIGTSANSAAQPGVGQLGSAQLGAAQPNTAGANAAAPNGQNRMVDYQQPLAGGQNGAPLASASPLGGGPSAGIGTPKSTAPGEIDADKPWLPLMLSMLLLFGSLGANMYLGWIAFESHFRYRKALVEGDYEERNSRSRLDDDSGSRRRG